MSLRGDVEDSIVTLLTPLKIPNVGGYLRTLSPYRGNPTPDADDPDLLRHIEGGTPAVLVTTTRADYEDPTGSHRRMARMELGVSLIIVSGIERDGESQNRGDGFDADPGAYDIMEAVRDRLWGVDLAVTNANRLRPADESFLFGTGERTGWALEFNLSALAQAADNEASDGDYTAIESRVNDPDDGDVSPVITQTQTLAT